MTTGERIIRLRTEKGYTQEYIANELGISRQAVHKWEKNETRPDTDNIIRLSHILDTTVEYILNGNERPANSCADKKKLPKIRTYIITIIITALITFIATVLFIANRPVSFDAGACGGGFATAVFDQYSVKLINDNYFSLTRDFKDNDVISIFPIRESRDLHYEGKAIYMSFDAEYTFTDNTTKTVQLQFMGERKWIQCYDWRLIN